MCFKMCLDRKCGVSQGRAGTSISETIRVPASELLVLFFHCIFHWSSRNFKSKISFLLHLVATFQLLEKSWWLSFAFGIFSSFTNPWTHIPEGNSQEKKTIHNCLRWTLSTVDKKPCTYGCPRSESRLYFSSLTLCILHIDEATTRICNVHAQFSRPWLDPESPFANYEIFQDLWHVTYRQRNPCGAFQVITDLHSALFRVNNFVSDVVGIPFRYSVQVRVVHVVHHQYQTSRFQKNWQKISLFKWYNLKWKLQAMKLRRASALAHVLAFLRQAASVYVFWRQKNTKIWLLRHNTKIWANTDRTTAPISEQSSVTGSN